MAATIAVIGTGCVGLTTGACFAHLGHRVICADIVTERVKNLRRGRIPIHEAGLADMVRGGLDSGNLDFVVGADNAVGQADFVYLCLPAPQGYDGPAEGSPLRGVVSGISAGLRPRTVVVNKSTGPLGSTRMIQQALGRSDVAVVSQPEFLREGTAVDDWLNPDRIVIGCDDPETAQRVQALYTGVRAPMLVTDPLSAETCKYATNAFLATKLSFVNALAAVCEAVGAVVDDVLLAMGLDHRIASEFLHPGPGWGGSCIPKDTRAVLSMAEEAGCDFSLLERVLAVNRDQFDRIVDKVEKATDLDGATVAMLGLAFKAGTDDTRESPALEIAKRLIARGARVQGHDPAVEAVDIDGLEVVRSAYAAAEGAKVLVVTTEWDEFRRLDLERIGACMVERHLIDARNLFDPDDVVRRGFTYTGIGRRSSNAAPLGRLPVGLEPLDGSDKPFPEVGARRKAELLEGA